MNDLVVRGVNEHQEVLLPRTYSREKIPAKRGQIPRPESVLGWPHLKRLSEHLMPYRQDVNVGLLVGANCTRAIKPREVIPSADDDPYPIRTTLGWGVIGNVNPKENGKQNDHCSCNRIVTREIGAESSKTVGHFVLKTHVKEVISPAQVGKLFEFDFNDAVGEDKAHSYLDRKFLNVVKANIHHREDGHYEIPLPLKEESLKLPNNKESAITRISKFKHWFKRDPKYREHYETFMEDTINNGHAEKVPPEELSLNNGRIWYIPHHGV